MGAKFGFEHSVEVDCARLEFCAEGIVDPVGGAVLDLMANGQKELEVFGDGSLRWATALPKAMSEFPVFVSAFLVFSPAYR